MINKRKNNKGIKEKTRQSNDVKLNGSDINRNKNTNKSNNEVVELGKENNNSASEKALKNSTEQKEQYQDTEVMEPPARIGEQNPLNQQVNLVGESDTRIGDEESVRADTGMNDNNENINKNIEGNIDTDGKLSENAAPGDKTVGNAENRQGQTDKKVDEDGKTAADVDGIPAVNDTNLVSSPKDEEKNVDEIPAKGLELSANEGEAGKEVNIKKSDEANQDKHVAKDDGKDTSNETGEKVKKNDSDGADREKSVGGKLDKDESDKAMNDKPKGGEVDKEKSNEADHDKPNKKDSNKDETKEDKNAVDDAARDGKNQKLNGATESTSPPSDEVNAAESRKAKALSFGFDDLDTEEDAAKRAELERKKLIEKNELERKKRRQDLVDAHKSLLDRRKSVGNANIQLQTKLAEYFRRKKADAAEQALTESGGSSSVLDASVDFAERYSKYIVTMVDIRSDFNSQKKAYDNHIGNLKEASSRRQHDAIMSHKDITTFLIANAKKAISNKTARALNLEVYLPHISLMEKKQIQVSEIRLDSIKLQNGVDKIESMFKSREDLSEGLRLIDFEQLKIENQTYNEKIEERNEEIGKLRRKITSTVQIMTHVKEKLQCVLNENVNLKDDLEQTDADLNKNRDKLTRIKQSRDSLRSVYARMQRSCGLLGKPELLRNYEHCMDSIANKTEEIDKLRQKTRGFLNRAKNYQNKLEDTKRDFSMQ